MAKIYYFVGSIFLGLLAHSYGQFSTAPCYEYGPLILCASNGATYASVCDFKTAQLFYPSLKPIHKGPCQPNEPIGPNWPIGPKKPNGPNWPIGPKGPSGPTNPNGWKPNGDYPNYDSNGKKPNVEYPDYNSKLWKPNVVYSDYDSNGWKPNKDYPNYHMNEKLVFTSGPASKETGTLPADNTNSDPVPVVPAETESKGSDRLLTGHSSYESNSDDDKTFYRSDKIRKAKHQYPRFITKHLRMKK